MDTDRTRDQRANATGTYRLLVCFFQSLESSVPGIKPATVDKAGTFDSRLWKKHTARSAALWAAEADKFRARLPVFIRVPKNTLRHIRTAILRCFSDSGKSTIYLRDEVSD